MFNYGLCLVNIIVLIHLEFCREAVVSYMGTLLHWKYIELNSVIRFTVHLLFLLHILHCTIPLILEDKLNPEIM